MPPKAMKAKPVMKRSPLLKRTASGKTPLVKGKKKVMKSSLKVSNLQKLGKMSLAEKVKKASEGAETAEEAATNLKTMLDKQEHSRVWSKIKKHSKAKPKKSRMSLKRKGRWRRALKLPCA